MKKLTVHKEGYHRKGYQRKNGTEVKAANVSPSTFQITDQGQPGRTPAEDQWYNPQVKTGWNKDEPMAKRREQMLTAHKGDVLASARALQALANVTTDPATKAAATADAQYFYERNRMRGGTHRVRVEMTSGKVPVHAHMTKGRAPKKVMRHHRRRSRIING